MPQPRSTTDGASKACTRAARCRATGSRVACSSPSGVKYIRRGQVAELRDRGPAQRGLGQRDGELRADRPSGAVRRSESCAASGSSSTAAPSATASASSCLAVVGQQPGEGVEVHRRILAEAMTGGRWHSVRASASFDVGTLPVGVPADVKHRQVHRTLKVEVDIVSVNIKPLEDRIVVKPLDAEQTTASGLVIPDTAKEKPQEGEVLAIGPGRIDDNGNRVPLDVDRRRQGHLQQVRRHRGQVLRRGVPHPLGARRARRRSAEPAAAT